MSNGKTKASGSVPADSDAVAVHTSVLAADAAAPTAGTSTPAAGCAGCGGCGGGCNKPEIHQPTTLRARDEFSGVAGNYVRDPVTGERRKVV